MMTDAIHHTWRYPIYTVAVGREEQIVVVDADGKECILLFNAKELAELYIAQSVDAGLSASLGVIRIGDAGQFQQGIEHLPAEVTHAIWDTTLEPQYFKMVSIDELLRSLRDNR